MLRIAVQSKGRLFEETMALLQEADIKIPSSKRILLVQSSNFPVEVLFLRDDDIPQSVANGIADLGIVGENEFVERNEDAEIVKRLGFSKCRLSLAIPKDVDYPGLSWFEGRKIATSYPGILERFMQKNGIKTDIHVITGSVEIAPGISLADAIFDIVSSGSTLVSNRLKEVEVVMQKGDHHWCFAGGAHHGFGGCSAHRPAFLLPLCDFRFLRHHPGRHCLRNGSRGYFDGRTPV